MRGTEYRYTGVPPALPQAGSARRAASRRGDKTQRRRAAGCRQLAGSTASEGMLVLRVILSARRARAKPPSSLN
jgi:hypothetical protein